MRRYDYLAHVSDTDSLISSIEDADGRRILIHFDTTDLKKETGKKIKKIIAAVKKSGIDAVLTFLPPCAFDPGENAGMFFEHEKPPVFVVDHLGLKQAVEKEDQDSLQDKILHEKCADCPMREEGKCVGIYFSRSSQKIIEKQAEWYIERIEKMKSGTILEIGCGITELLEIYKAVSSGNTGVKFVCADPDAYCNRVLMGNIGNSRGVMQIICTGEDLPLRKNSMDAVLMRNCYYHFKDLEAVLENIRKVLRREGFLVILDHESEIYEKSNSFFNHYRNHRFKEAVAGIEKNGFVVEESFEEDGSWGILASNG